VFPNVEESPVTGSDTHVDNSLHCNGVTTGVKKYDICYEETEQGTIYSFWEWGKVGQGQWKHPDQSQWGIKVVGVVAIKVNIDIGFITNQS
jgi:hypothetical protein